MVNILIGCTGCISTEKIPSLVEYLETHLNKPSVQVVATEGAEYFFDPSVCPFKVWENKDEWKWKKGGPIIYETLSKWADIFLLAPLDENTIGKLAMGLCDDLLTIVARSWDMKNHNKHIVFCPEMNVLMWQHPSTEKNINILKEWGYREVPPTYKKSPSGGIDMEVMASFDAIANTIKGLIPHDI